MKRVEDNELKMVSGGSFMTTYEDWCLLRKKGYVPADDLNIASFVIHWDRNSEIVDQGWKRAEVISVTDPVGDNSYYDFNHVPITRAEAIKRLGLLV